MVPEDTKIRNGNFIHSSFIFTLAKISFTLGEPFTGLKEALL